MVAPLEQEADVVFWLYDVNDPVELAWSVAEEHRIGVPLLYGGEAAWTVYPRPSDTIAPFPLRVVIDREGVITRLAYEHDPEADRAAILEALAR